MLRDVFYAMGAKTDAYYDFIEYNKKRVWGHGTLVWFIEAILILFGIIFTMAIPYSRFLAENDGLDGWIDKNIPYFEIVDGYLYCEEEYEYDSDELFAFISTNYEFTTEDLHNFGFWKDVLLADYEKIIAKIKKDNALVVYVIDLFSFEGSLNSKLTMQLNGLFLPNIS